MHRHSSISHPTTHSMMTHRHPYTSHARVPNSQYLCRKQSQDHLSPHVPKRTGPWGRGDFFIFYLTLSTLMQSPFQKDYLDRWGRGLKTDNALTGLCWRWRKCSAVCVAALGVQCVMNWGIVTLIKNCKVPCMSISGSDLNQKFWCHFHSKCAVYLPCFDLSLLGSSL